MATYTNCRKIGLESVANMRSEGLSTASQVRQSPGSENVSCEDDDGGSPSESPPSVFERFAEAARRASNLYERLVVEAGELGEEDEGEGKDWSRGAIEDEDEDYGEEAAVGEEYEDHESEGAEDSVNTVIYHEPERASSPEDVISHYAVYRAVTREAEGLITRHDEDNKALTDEERKDAKILRFLFENNEALTREVHDAEANFDKHQDKRFDQPWAADDTCNLLWYNANNRYQKALLNYNVFQKEMLCLKEKGPTRITREEIESKYGRLSRWYNSERKRHLHHESNSVDPEELKRKDERIRDLEQRLESAEAGLRMAQFDVVDLQDRVHQEIKRRAMALEQAQRAAWSELQTMQKTRFTVVRFEQEIDGLRAALWRERNPQREMAFSALKSEIMHLRRALCIERAHNDAVRARADERMHELAEERAWQQAQEETQQLRAALKHERDLRYAKEVAMQAGVVCFPTLNPQHARPDGVDGGSGVICEVQPSPVHAPQMQMREGYAPLFFRNFRSGNHEYQTKEKEGRLEGAFRVVTI